ncbi:hypothetical protein ACFZA1_35535 [Streptomyces filipinensis]|uniref:hypothetical protein n=1 Tax=Streptomyces filipinensis TaxID=66887 RepID=UPI0004CD84BB
MMVSKFLVGALLALFGAVPVVLFLLLVVLATVAAFPGTIEIDGLGAVFWAVLLSLPCAALASAVLYPLRLLGLRNRYALGWLSMFLTAVLVMAWTPGLHTSSLWPAVCLATLEIPLGWWLQKRDEQRRTG